MKTPQARAYCYGMIVESNPIRLVGSYPEADGYGEIAASDFMPSGEACASAIVLSRLGCRVTLDGAWLSGPRSAEVRAMIGKQGVDTRRLRRSPEGQGFREVVIGDGHTRTVFGSFGRILSGQEEYWNQPIEADIRRSDFVTLDSQFGKKSEAVADMAARAGKAFTASDPVLGQRLLGLAAAATISMEHLRSKGLAADPLGALARYGAEMDGLCALTLGKEGVAYLRSDKGRAGKIERLEAFAITPLDSLGAGDSFRAALALGLHLGLCDRDALVFSSAVSALVCLSTPGVLNGPRLVDVARFLMERGQGGIADRVGA
jgi:ribokinase